MTEVGDELSRRLVRLVTVGALGTDAAGRRGAGGPRVGRADRPAVRSWVRRAPAWGGYHRRGHWLPPARERGRLDLPGDGAADGGSLRRGLLRGARARWSWGAVPGSRFRRLDGILDLHSSGVRIAHVPAPALPHRPFPHSALASGGMVPRMYRHLRRRGQGP